MRLEIEGPWYKLILAQRLLLENKKSLSTSPFFQNLGLENEIEGPWLKLIMAQRLLLEN